MRLWFSLSLSHIHTHIPPWNSASSSVKELVLTFQQYYFSKASCSCSTIRSPWAHGTLLAGFGLPPEGCKNPARDVPWEGHGPVLKDFIFSGHVWRMSMTRFPAGEDPRGQSEAIPGPDISAHSSPQPTEPVTEGLTASLKVFVLKNYQGIWSQATTA